MKIKFLIVILSLLSLALSKEEENGEESMIYRRSPECKDISPYCKNAYRRMCHHAWVNQLCRSFCGNC
ncbi:hypothetical protein ABFA07_016184 [Porites harrisoni]